VKGVILMVKDLEAFMLETYSLFHMLSISRYSVFGLGSSAYPNFCAFAKRVDDLLNKFGFKRLLELYTADEKKNQDLAFREWSLEAYSVSLCSVFRLIPLEKV